VHKWIDPDSADTETDYEYRACSCEFRHWHSINTVTDSQKTQCSWWKRTLD